MTYNVLSGTLSLYTTTTTTSAAVRHSLILSRSSSIVCYASIYFEYSVEKIC